MKKILFLFMFLALSVLKAQTADGFKYPLHAEPQYESKTPRYMFFFMGSKTVTKSWLVIDSTKFYVDRNGNGDITEEDEAGDCSDFFFMTRLNMLPAGDRDHYRVRMNRADGDDSRFELMLYNLLGDLYILHQDGDSRVTFGSDQLDAPVACLGNHLEIAVYEKKLRNDSIYVKTYIEARGYQVSTRLTGVMGPKTYPLLKVFVPDNKNQSVFEDYLTVRC